MTNDGPGFDLPIKTPRWAVPLLAPARLKGARGGRSSGKSHFFAELAVEKMILDPDASIVCIREIQKSLKFSAKKLVENKIRALGVSHMFNILTTEISRIGGTGVMIFQGMQDHTADSIKSLEDFDVAWVEEAQSISARSIELLIPTMRKTGSEVWFSWNPEKKNNAVEVLFRERPRAVLVHANYTDNPWTTQEALDEALAMMASDIEKYNHIWLGGFNEVSEAQIFRGRYVVDDFTPGEEWDGPYYGVDWGFAKDPTAGVKAWVFDRVLYIEYDMARHALELDKTAPALIEALPGIADHVSRADNSRPDTISYVRRKGLPKLEACKKGKGSVEDGVEFIKSFNSVVIHPRCEDVKEEFDEYSYKVDRLSGDITPVIIDDFNHCIDSLRYALEPIMRDPENIKRGLLIPKRHR